MSVFRFVTLAALGAALSAPLSAQGIPRNARPTRATTNAPRLMVANPYVFSAADSANAVAAGDGMRRRMEKVAGRDFQVIPDTIMNSALTQYGYPKNAILIPQLAVTLAKNIQSRLVITSTMTKGEGGRGTLHARLVGVNDEAGYVVTQSQEAGQSFPDFGAKAADAMAPGVKALGDARECVDLRTTKPDKAIEAAQKALKAAPNHGLASLCLAQIAIEQKKPRGEVINHLQSAVKGDNLSLTAYSLLAEQFQAANDTASTVAVFTDLLRVAPTNQRLRENIFRYLLQAGRPEVAKGVADSGLRLDPYNADLYDLKANACLFLSDYKCAVEALETAYSVDSTKADSLFLTKVIAVNEQRIADTLPRATQADTARYVKWVQLGAKKYPDNLSILEALNRAYSYSGQVDSSLAVTQRLMAKDSTAVGPALAAVQALASAKRLNEATPYIDFVTKRGDAQQKEQLALIMVNAALPYLQKETQDLPAAADLARRGVALSEPGGKLAVNANYVLGLALFQQALAMDAETEKKKSCEMARQEQALLTEAETALKAGEAAKPDVVAKYLEGVKGFRPRIASMLKAYCK
jgi:tetratricopeptide (TPR) repeat protein